MTNYYFIPLEAETALKNITTDNQLPNTYAVTGYYITANITVTEEFSSIVNGKGFPIRYSIFNPFLLCSQKLIGFILLKENLSPDLTAYLLANNCKIFSTVNELYSYLNTL